MKVLEIMGSLHRGGAETMIMNYYRAFDKQKCQMDFVIHARFIDDYCVEAESMGARIIELERPRKAGVINYIRSLTKIIKEYGPYEAVHIHTDYQAFLSVIAAKKAGIKKIIVHSHNTVFPKGTVLLNRIIMDLISVTRIGCGKAAGKAFFGSHKFEVINNAIKTKKFSNVNGIDYKKIKQERFGNKKVIGHIGRFNIQKNHDFIIELANSIRKENDNIIFALYGEGDREEEIRKKVAMRGLENVVLFMGVTNDTITAYHTFDTFILPSNWEGFPVTLVESQLSGVMSVASDRISSECDLKAGLIKFLPLNVTEWTKHIINILDTKKDDKRDVPAEVSCKFDIDTQWKVLYRIYAA